MTARDAIFKEMGWVEAEDGLLDNIMNPIKKAAGAVGGKLTSWAQKPPKGGGAQTPQSELEKHDKQSHPGGYKGGRCTVRGRLAKQGFDVRGYDMRVSKFEAPEGYDYDKENAPKDLEEGTSTEGAESPKETTEKVNIAGMDLTAKGKEEQKIAEYLKSVIEDPSTDPKIREAFQKALNEGVQKEEGESKSSAQKAEASEEPESGEPIPTQRAVSDEEYERFKNHPDVQEYKEKVTEYLSKGGDFDLTDQNEFPKDGIADRVINEVLEERHALGQKVVEYKDDVDILKYDDAATAQVEWEDTIQKYKDIVGGKTDETDFSKFTPAQQQALRALANDIGLNLAQAMAHPGMNTQEFQNLLDTAAKYEAVKARFAATQNASASRSANREVLEGTMRKDIQKTNQQKVVEEIDGLLGMDDKVIHPSTKEVLEGLKDRIQNPKSETDYRRANSEYARLLHSPIMTNALAETEAEEEKDDSTVEKYIEDGDENHRKGGVIESKNEYPDWKVDLDSIPDGQEGNGSVDNAEGMKEKISNDLQEVGFPAAVSDIKMRNLISTTEFSFKFPKGTILKNDALANLKSRIETEFPLAKDKQLFINYSNRDNTLTVTVENDHVGFVSHKKLLQSKEFQDAVQRGEPVVALGIDSDGKPIIGNLTDYVHILLAGQTDSGKSARLGSILSSLLMQSPDNLKLILVDPKQVEFAGYENDPHLIGNIVSDGKEAINKFNYLINEQENRYRLLKQAGVKNLQEYNKKGAEGLLPEGLPKHLPSIALVVDEFGDLMDTNGKDVEKAIKRLGQKARAAGIHLVLATQRPSAKNITGDIKANIPTTFGLHVKDGIEARIVGIDDLESLPGRGPLVIKDKKNKVTRVDGSFMDNDGLDAIIKGSRGNVKSERKGLQESVDDIAETAKDKGFLRNVAARIERGEMRPMAVPADIADKTKQLLESQGIEYTEESAGNGMVQIIPKQKEQPTVASESANATGSEAQSSVNKEHLTEELKQRIKPSEQFPLTVEENLTKDFPVGTIVERSDGHQYIRVEGTITDENGVASPKWEEHNMHEGRPARPAEQSHALFGTSRPDEGGSRIVSMPEGAVGVTQSPTETPDLGYLTPEEEEIVKNNKHALTQLKSLSKRLAESEKAFQEAHTSGTRQAQDAASAQFSADLEALNEVRHSLHLPQLNKFGMREDIKDNSAERTPKSGDEVGTATGANGEGSKESGAATESKVDQEDAVEASGEGQESTMPKMSRRAAYHAKYPQTREGQMQRMENILNKKFDELAAKNIDEELIEQTKEFRRLKEELQAEIDQKFPETPNEDKGQDSERQVEQPRQPDDSGIQLSDDTSKLTGLKKIAYGTAVNKYNDGIKEIIGQLKNGDIELEDAENKASELLNQLNSRRKQIGFSTPVKDNRFSSSNETDKAAEKASEGEREAKAKTRAQAGTATNAPAKASEEGAAEEGEEQIAEEPAQEEGESDASDVGGGGADGGENIDSGDNDDSPSDDGGDDSNGGGGTGGGDGGDEGSIGDGGGANPTTVEPVAPDKEEVSQSSTPSQGEISQPAQKPLAEMSEEEIQAAIDNLNKDGKMKPADYKKALKPFKDELTKRQAEKKTAAKKPNKKTKPSATESEGREKPAEEISPDATAATANTNKASTKAETPADANDDGIAKKVESDKGIQALQKKVDNAKSPSAKATAQKQLDRAKAQLTEALRTAATPESGVKDLRSQKTDAKTVQSTEQTSQKKETPSAESQKARNSLAEHLSKGTLTLEDTGIAGISELSDAEADAYAKATEEYSTTDARLKEAQREYNKMRDEIKAAKKWKAAGASDKEKEEHKAQIEEMEDRLAALEDAKFDAEDEAQMAYDRLSDVESSIRDKRAGKSSDATDIKSEMSPELKSKIEDNASVKKMQGILDQLEKEGKEGTPEYREAKNILASEVKGVKTNAVAQLYEDEMGGGEKGKISPANRELALDIVEAVDNKDPKTLMQRMVSPISVSSKGVYKAEEGVVARKAFEMLTGIKIPDLTDADVGKGNKSNHRLGKLFKNKVSKIINGFCARKNAAPASTESKKAPATPNKSTKPSTPSQSTPAPAAKSNAKPAEQNAGGETPQMKAYRERQEAAAKAKAEAESQRKAEHEARLEQSRQQRGRTGRDLNAQSKEYKEQAREAASETTSEGMKSLKGISSPKEVSEASARALNEQLDIVNKEIQSIAKSINNLDDEIKDPKEIRQKEGQLAALREGLQDLLRNQTLGRGNFRYERIKDPISGDFMGLRITEFKNADGGYTKVKNEPQTTKKEKKENKEQTSSKSDDGKDVSSGEQRFAGAEEKLDRIDAQSQKNMADLDALLKGGTDPTSASPGKKPKKGRKKGTPTKDEATLFDEFVYEPVAEDEFENALSVWDIVFDAALKSMSHAKYEQIYQI